MGVICKYYQQGRCRFGNECKFQHSDVYDDDGGSNRGGRVSDQYRFYKSDKPDVNVILQAVQQEIISSEKGNQWPLSCFAPMKEYGNISGWEDISPEELRWQMYLSMQSGNLDECIKQIQEVHLKVKINKNAMLNPTLESYSILESIFTKDASSFSFGQTESQPPNAFTSGGFGASDSFAPAQGTGVFGTVATGHSLSIFGGAATTPVQPSPFFGTSVFGNTSVASSRNVFGNVPTVSPANVFGNVPTVSPTNVFGNVAPGAPSSANVFGAEAHSSSIFGAHQAQPVGQTFGGQTFGNTLQQQAFPFQSSAPTIFGNTNAGGFGSDQNTSLAGDDTYTPLTELPEDMLALFKADKYVMGKIPTVPPPRESCL